MFSNCYLYTIIMGITPTVCDSCSVNIDQVEQATKDIERHERLIEKLHEELEALKIRKRKSIDDLKERLNNLKLTTNTIENNVKHIKEMRQDIAFISQFVKKASFTDLTKVKPLH